MDVLVTYIVRDSMVPATRKTIEEMLMEGAGYASPYQNYSKNFFQFRTFEATALEEDLSKLDRILQTPYSKEYYTFRIPKMSGGTRLIKAPAEPLKELQKEIADLLQDYYKVWPHNAAYAYTRGRCAYDALVTHQRANARWFLKLDIRDFFPSITEEVLQKLRRLHPLNNMTDDQLETLSDIATDGGSLPQGSPLSPILSNLVMVEFDKVFYNKVKRFKNQPHMYTRYADDMIISCPYTFKFQDVVELMEETFKELELPFVISKHKLRYGSKAGRNWNLGLMYTQDQKITVGQKRKRELHSLVNSFVVEYPWDVQSTQELIGKLGYLKNVEPDYYDKLINKYESKYQVNIPNMIKDILNNNI